MYDSTFFKELHEATFAKTIAQGITIVFFWSTTCTICQRLEPIAHSLARSYSPQITFAKVNIDDYPTLAREQNVQFLPTIKIFRRGLQLARIVGLKSEDLLRDAIKEAVGPALSSQ